MIPGVKFAAFSNIAEHAVQQNTVVEFIEEVVNNAHQNPTLLSNGTEQLACTLTPLDRIQPNFQMLRSVEMAPELVDKCVKFLLKAD
jgi:hypothetical protein